MLCHGFANAKPTMDYVLPSLLLQRDVSKSNRYTSSMIFLNMVSCDSHNAVSVLTSVLLNIANEAAVQNLRTVYIRKDPVLKSYWVHLHGTSQMDSANWDNIHFIQLPNEPAFVHWFSRVHLGRRFADLIIVDGLERLFSQPDRMRASDVLRLTGLLEDTRNFIDTSTNPEDHGHGCRLLVTCCLPVQSSDSTHSPSIPVHALEETFIFSEDSTNRYSILAQKDRWKLNLEYVEGELFWKTFHPPPNAAARKT
ncbi:hypothetical protein CRM22_000041 [Opisthorchis felineus]|uniref:Elongator complex protein 5 n=1 Tax=Opisthorchis felineus TaxID=147828 RepID=A0A4S2MNA3_OPIFE|nr:hypothetical protein CRM22_000041 [Opisthorchis felineus]